MRRVRIRFLLTFLAGVMAAALTGVIAGSAGSRAATRYEELSVFTNVLNLVRRNYVEPVEEDELVKGALRGMLAELDPHSSFLDAEAYKEMQVDTKGEFHGLGIEISKRKDGYVDVVSPIEGTPAAQAGIVRTFMPERDVLARVIATEPRACVLMADPKRPFVGVGRGHAISMHRRYDPLLWRMHGQAEADARGERWRALLAQLRPSHVIADPATAPVLAKVLDAGAWTRVIADGTVQAWRSGDTTACDRAGEARLRAERFAL